VLTDEEAAKIEFTDTRRLPLSLQNIARWVATGTLDVRIGNCLGLLASASVRAAEEEDFEDRLSHLEKALGDRR